MKKYFKSGHIQTEKKIITSIIGTGTHAYVWGDEIKKNSQYLIKNVLSRSEERGKKFATYLNCGFAESIQDIYNDSEVDLVIICSSPDRNLLAIDLAKHKKNLILEKPLSLNLKDAELIHKACKENGIICGAGLNRNYDTFFKKLQKHTEKMGSIVSGEFKAYFKTTDIEKNIKNVGGIFLSKLVHNFDQCNKIFGKPKEIVATELVAKNNNIITGSHAIIKYKNNKVVNFNINLNNTNHLGEILILYCEKGLITINFNLFEITSISEPLNYKYSYFILKSYLYKLICFIKNIKKKKIFKFNKKKDVLIDNFWFGVKQDILENFSRQLKNQNDKNLVNIDNNFISTKMALACEESIKKKIWIKI